MMKQSITLMLCVLGFAGQSLWSQTSSVTRVVDGRTYYVHTVKSGETLYKLSKLYTTTVQSIKDANSGSEDIKIGQQLLIPSKMETPVVDAALPVGPTVTHVVKSGETLSKIAVTYHTTVAKIKETNNLSSTDIRIGQKLTIQTDINTTETMPVVVENPVNIEEPKVEPAVVVVPAEKKSRVEPLNPRNADTSGKISKGVVGGMPETADVVLAETATEKEDIALAEVVDGGMDQTRTFVKHPTLPKGSIVVVINEETGKMAYCRVVENAKISDMDGAGLLITKAVADKIGMKVSGATVKIRYAAP